VSNGLTEEERAELWRQQTQNRIAFQIALWQQLQAPPEPRQAVIDAWTPVILAQAEAAAGPTDPEDDP
jgi:hypothetical protein